MCQKITAMESSDITLEFAPRQDLTAQDLNVLMRVQDLLDENPQIRGKIMQHVIPEKKKPSLRSLHMFVTDMCRKTPIFVTNVKGETVNVYEDYKKYLDSYHITYFAPFDRISTPSPLVKIKHRSFIVVRKLSYLFYIWWIFYTNIPKYV
jgi:hypothetical protein